jgi:hypothetical protein
MENPVITPKQERTQEHFLALLGKRRPTAAQPVNKLLNVYGSRRLITPFK